MRGRKRVSRREPALYEEDRLSLPGQETVLPGGQGLSMCGIRGHVPRRPEQGVHPQRVPVSPAVLSPSLPPPRRSPQRPPDPARSPRQLPAAIRLLRAGASSRKPSLPTSCLPRCPARLVLAPWAHQGGSLCVLLLAALPPHAGGASLWVDLGPGPGRGARGRGSPVPTPTQACGK